MLTIIPAISYAQTKVGIINVPRLLKESKASQIASKKLEKEFGQREKTLKQLVEKFKETQSQLERNAATTSDSERRKKERALADQNRNLQRLQREFREDFEQRQSEETTKIIKKAQVIINEIAKDDNYDLILRDAVYASPAVDITERVVNKLN